MKFRFKVQPFQTEAVEAVADCFLGQPLDTGLRYRIDPGTVRQGQTQRLEMDEGFRNPDIALPLPAVLKNLQAVQVRQNVFVIGMLKKSGDSTTSRRQEVGRGLRLCVNQSGDRMDDPATVHDINVLTVVASEGYKEFVAGLQKDIMAVLSSRPQKADAAYFTGKILKTEAGDIPVTSQMANSIAAYLFDNDYVDKDDKITPGYHEARQARTIAPLPAKLAAHASEILQLIDSVYSKDQLPEIENGRKGQPNPLNANFHKKAFRDLWSRIHQKAIYSVQFDTSELIEKCVQTLDIELRVAPLQYVVQRGEQAADTTYEALNVVHQQVIYVQT